jgi:hypothetical protein
MKKLSTFFLSILALVASTAAMAQDVSPRSWLYLEKADGEITEILFTGAEMLVTDEDLTVNTPDEQLKFAFSEIRSFYFLKSGTSVVNPKADALLAYVADGILHVVGSYPLGAVSVFNPVGQLQHKTVTAATEILIPVSDFAKGVYFVRVQGQSVKIIL